MEFGAGQKVSVFIRPESVVLTKEIQEGQFKGIIRERTFLGEKVDYLLEVDGLQLSATSYDPLRHGTFSLHEEVGVLFDSQTIKILREEGRAQ
jgi:ABC-type Fe3+/spermidine/putrescine transport system ATPase subunit